MYIHTVPDNTYGVQQVNSRFELPAALTESPRFPAILEAEARRIARLTVDKNKLRGYHWRDDLGVEVDKSELQISFDSTPTLEALNQGENYSENFIAYVVKMWFVSKQVRTEEITYDTDEEARSEGYVKDLKQFEDEV